MKILDDFSKTKVLVIGDVMLDRYWWGNVARISPEAPVPVVRLDKTTLAAGGAANVAANVAGLGAEPLLVGIVGVDDDARCVREVLMQSGVSPDHLIQIPGRPTTVKTRVIAHSQQVARVDQEMDHDLEKQYEDKVIANLADLLPAANAVIVSDYAKGLLTDGLLSRLMSMARAAGISVLVDPKGKDYVKYNGATLITPNRREAAEACNFHEGANDLVLRAGTQLLDDLSIDGVLVTQGEDGMTLFRRDIEPRHFQTAARKVYDVTGAGDTVIATLATALGAGADLDRSTNLANIAAGFVVEQVGTSAISLADLQNAINDHIEAGTANLGV